MSAHGRDWWCFKGSRESSNLNRRPVYNLDSSAAVGKSRIMDYKIYLLWKANDFYVPLNALKVQCVKSGLVYDFKIGKRLKYYP